MDMREALDQVILDRGTGGADVPAKRGMPCGHRDPMRYTLHAGLYQAPCQRLVRQDVNLMSLPVSTKGSAAAVISDRPQQ
jgi:hypothetical protein